MTTQDQFLRMNDLANIPQRKARTYTNPTNGTIKRISARPASKGMVGVSDKTIWTWIKQGEFPKPIKLGNITVWKLSEVQDWMQSKGLGA